MALSFKHFAAFAIKTSLISICSVYQSLEDWLWVEESTLAGGDISLSPSAKTAAVADGVVKFCDESFGE
jgi:hypothetical protein